MNIAGYIFREPIQIEASSYINLSAVYVVMTHDNKNWLYIYAGQTENVGQRFDHHEKWNCWLQNKNFGGLYVAILPENKQQSRLKIETAVREAYPMLPCNNQ